MLSLDAIKNIYYRHQQSNIHAVKTGIAFLIGYFIMLWVPWERSLWILVTIAVIMSSQAVLGLQISKSILRLLGTLVGASVGILALYLPSQPVLLAAILFLLAVFFSKFASRYSKMSYVATLGMATFILIALADEPSLQLAFYRIIDIAIGVSICVLVSRFILPLNARRAFLLKFVNNFQQLSVLSEEFFIKKESRHANPDIIRLELKIINQLVNMRELINVVRYEKFKSTHLKKELNLIYRYQRAIFHYILFIEMALREGRQEDSVYIDAYFKPLGAYFELLIKFFSNFKIEKTVVIEPEMNEALNAVKESINDLFSNKNLPQNEQQRKDVILFSLRRLGFVTKNLIMHWNSIH